jgi:hypothetical protein
MKNIQQPGSKTMTQSLVKMKVENIVMNQVVVKILIAHM